MNILFISLGCDKNLVDSEVMLGILAKDGHQMVDDETMQMSLSLTPAALSMTQRKRVSRIFLRWQN